MNTIEQRFEKLVTDIEETISRLDAGEAVNLDPLNQEISDVCSAAHVSEATRQKMQLPMAKLILKLDELASCLKTHQERLRNLN